MKIQIRWRCRAYSVDNAIIPTDNMFCRQSRVIRALSDFGSLRSACPTLGLPNIEPLNEIAIFADFYLHDHCDEHEDFIQDQASQAYDISECRIGTCDSVVLYSALAYPKQDSPSLAQAYCT